MLYRSHWNINKILGHILSVFATIVWVFQHHQAYNTVVVVSLCLTAVDTVRRKTGPLTNMSVRSSLLLMVRMFCTLYNPGRTTLLVYGNEQLCFQKLSYQPCPSSVILESVAPVGSPVLISSLTVSVTVSANAAKGVPRLTSNIRETVMILTILQEHTVSRIKQVKL